MRLFFKVAIFLITTGYITANDSANKLEQFFSSTIEEESLAIQETCELQNEKLASLYIDRGESYLVVGQNKKAFDDFQRAYHYTKNSFNQDEATSLTFRSLLGAFLVFVRMENLPAVETFGVELQKIIKNYSCEACYKKSNNFGSEQLQPYRHTHVLTRLISTDQPDWPILGPDEISKRDCLERVETTERALYLLIAAVKKSEVRAIATTIIKALADQAASCCRAGGLWKGCLQKLVNKLHYWKVLGIPADPAWD